MASAFPAVVRIGELRAAITDLRENLDGGVTREDVYQTWCDNHSWAFGNAYVARDNWRSIGIGDQVDLLMKSTASGFRDIFELKHPDMEVLSFDTTHRNYLRTCAGGGCPFPMQPTALPASHPSDDPGGGH